MRPRRREPAELKMFAQVQVEELEMLGQGLGAQAAVWLYLRRCGRDAFPSHERIALYTGLTMDSVRSAVKRLTKSGLISVARVEGRQHYTTFVKAIPERATNIRAGTPTDPNDAVGFSAQEDGPERPEFWAGTPNDVGYSAHHKRDGRETEEKQEETRGAQAQDTPRTTHTEVPHPASQKAHATPVTQTPSAVHPQAEAPAPVCAPALAPPIAPPPPVAQLALVPDVDAPAKPKRGKKPPATQDADVVALHALWQKVTGKDWALNAERAGWWREVLEKAGGSLFEAEHAVRGLVLDDLLMGRRPGKSGVYVEPRVIKNNYDRLHDLGVDAAEQPASSMDTQAIHRRQLAEVDAMVHEASADLNPILAGFTERTSDAYRARFKWSPPDITGVMPGGHRVFLYSRPQRDDIAPEHAVFSSLTNRYAKLLVVRDRVVARWGKDTGHFDILATSIELVQEQMRAMHAALKPSEKVRTFTAAELESMRAAQQPSTTEVVP